jgi:hypothetical protein
VLWDPSEVRLSQFSDFAVEIQNTNHYSVDIFVKMLPPNITRARAFRVSPPAFRFGLTTLSPSSLPPPPSLSPLAAAALRPLEQLKLLKRSFKNFLQGCMHAANGSNAFSVSCVDKETSVPLLPHRVRNVA